MADIHVTAPWPGDSARGIRTFSRFSEFWSVHVLTAVDRQGRAGDEAALVGDQEQHTTRNLGSLAKTADRHLGNDLLSIKSSECVFALAAFFTIHMARQ
jgi:hypothetical protein